MVTAGKEREPISFGHVVVVVDSWSMELVQIFTGVRSYFGRTQQPAESARRKDWKRLSETVSRISRRSLQTTEGHMNMSWRILWIRFVGSRTRVDGLISLVPGLSSPYALSCRVYSQPTYTTLSVPKCFGAPEIWMVFKSDGREETKPKCLLSKSTIF